ncbi:hypothetical protein ACFRJ8_19830 [Arthrobacter sp. NPDC056886]|uniref:hypothetical protein n=1 Tax=Arthrobacter sp. NPDC056886 TaxID=3345960 RepID=UPI0036712072
MDNRSSGAALRGHISSSFDRRLWAAANKNGVPASLVHAHEVLGLERGEQLAFETVMCDGNLVDMLFGQDSGFATLTNGSSSLVRISDDDGDFVVASWATAHPGVFHISGSVPTSDRRWARVNRSISRAPDVMRCFLNEDKFRRLARKLDSIGRPEVVRMAAWRQSDASSLNRGWPAKADSFRYTPDDVFDLANLEGASVRSLTVSVESDLLCHLRRTSGATFYSGQFRAFAANILDSFAAYAAERLDLLSNRQRAVDRPLGLPLTINLAEDVFSTAGDTERLRRLMEDTQLTSVAVLHENPYLHLMIADHADGSTFDVVVTSPVAIDIYPSFRSSASSLARLVQRIGEHFSAETIEESLPRQRVSLEDLVGAG